MCYCVGFCYTVWWGRIARNYDALAEFSFMTLSISSLVRWHTRRVPQGELVIGMAPEGRVVVVYWSVRTGRLFLGMCKAVVCDVALYRVLRG